MKKKFFTIALVFLCLVLFPTFCHAKYTIENAEGFLQETNKGAGAEETDVYKFSGKIVEVGLGVVGLVFFILIFYGGYLWLTSQGKEEQIKQAQDTIIASIIGLVIIVGSYAATNFVVNRLIGATTSELPSEKDGDPNLKQGCCLDAYEAEGGFFGSVYGKEWHSSVTDKETCVKNANVCSGGDQICGTVEGQDWQWLEGVVDSAECAKVAGWTKE